MRAGPVLKAGIVGVGSTCDAHVAALRRLANVHIVGICDAEPAKAKRASAAQRIPMMQSLNDLRHAGATVIHVLTPPDTHADLVTRALDFGCHVFVETPVASDVADCRAMANVAAARKLQICVGHSLSFEPRVRRALQMARAGKLGKVVSADFLSSNHLAFAPQFRSAGAPFRQRAVDPLHVFEALIGPIEHVQADWKNVGDTHGLAFDEWRAHVRCRDGFGQCHLSWNVRPVRDRLIIQGTRETMQVDIPRGDVAIAPLIAEFYQALCDGRAAPVTIDDAKRVVQWTERIARLAEQDYRRRLSHHRLSERVPYLVTDSACPLGRAVVARLRDQGRRVRVLVGRPPESTTEGVECAVGDPCDPDAVDRAVRGASVVIHTATSGTVGTENLVHSCLNHNSSQLVYLSSLCVLDPLRPGPLRESSRLESDPTSRDERTQRELACEQIISLAAAHHRLPALILRVGQLFGDELPLVTPDVARLRGALWIVLGNGERRVPLIHIDDAVNAILRAASSRRGHGEIVHLVGDESPTQNEILAAAAVGNDATVIHLPRWLVIAAGAIATAALKLFGQQASAITPHRLRCAMSRGEFTSDQRDVLDGWRPTVGMHGTILGHVTRSRGRLARNLPAEELLLDPQLPSLGTSEPRA